MIVKPKTAILFIDVYDLNLSFYTTTEDVADFNGKFINCCKTQEMQNRLNDFFYNEDGTTKQPSVTKETFLETIRRGGDLVITGFID